MSTIKSGNRRDNITANPGSNETSGRGPALAAKVSVNVASGASQVVARPEDAPSNGRGVRIQSTANQRIALSAADDASSSTPVAQKRCSGPAAPSTASSMTAAAWFISLQSYAAGEANQALSAAAASGAPANLVLSDGTKVSFLGATQSDARSFM